MRNLVICANLCHPYVDMSGNAAIFGVLKELSKKGVDLHIITSLSSSCEKLKNSKNLKFYYISTDNLIIFRLIALFKAIWLGLKLRVVIIHDFASLPILTGFTGFVGKVIGAKSIETICTVNTSFLGSSSLYWGNELIDATVGVDRITTRSLRKAGAKKVKYLPLGGDLKRFKSSRDLTKERILFLGSLESRKGAQILAASIKDVVSKYPNILFTFAFFGKELRDVKHSKNLTRLKRITENFPKNVEYLSGTHNVSKLMSSTKIFVLPTTTRHGTLGQSLTLLEAMAAGKPCVVSDIYKKDGLVKNGVNCLLFKNKDSSDLANKILKFLLKGKVREDIAKNAQRRVLSEFDVSITAQRLYEFYDRLI